MKKSTIIAGFTILVLGTTSLATATMADARKGKGPGGERPDFSQLDANGDGQITQSDIDENRAQRFAAVDSNSDGALSQDELIAAGNAKMAERIKERTQKMLEKRDANNDGSLSPDELQPRDAGRMFKRLDKDGDGAITKAEFDAAKDGRRGHRKDKRGDDN